MNPPKYVQEILNWFHECWAEVNCILCLDCIAFALKTIEDAPVLKVRRSYIIKPGKVWNFIKFLMSTISKGYNPCNRCKFNPVTIRKFGRWILRLTPDQRKGLRASIFCHAEFKPSKDEDKLGLKIFNS